MSNCCKPQLNVIASSTTSTVGFVTLTVDKLWSTVGDNSCLKLCISRAMIPAANTDRIQITDGTTILPAFQCNGNYLRADSLRSFLCKHARGCCAFFDFTIFKGNDPAHVTFCNKMCPSNFVTAVVGE